MDSSELEDDADDSDYLRFKHKLNRCHADMTYLYFDKQVLDKYREVNRVEQSLQYPNGYSIVDADDPDSGIDVFQHAMRSRVLMLRLREWIQLPLSERVHWAKYNLVSDEDNTTTVDKFNLWRKGTLGTCCLASQHKYCDDTRCQCQCHERDGYYTGELKP